MRIVDDAVVLYAFGAAVVTGADWLLVVTVALGSAGIGGVSTAWLGVAKYRSEQRQMKIMNSVQVRTVAAEEAEAAMRIMGETVDRVNAAYAALAAQHDALTEAHRAMRDDLNQCLAEQRRQRG